MCNKKSAKIKLDEETNRIALRYLKRFSRYRPTKIHWPPQILTASKFPTGRGIEPRLTHLLFFYRQDFQIFFAERLYQLSLNKNGPIRALTAPNSKTKRDIDLGLTSLDSSLKNLCAWIFKNFCLRKKSSNFHLFESSNSYLIRMYKTFLLLEEFEKIMHI